MGVVGVGGGDRGNGDCGVGGSGSRRVKHWGKGRGLMGVHGRRGVMGGGGLGAMALGHGVRLVRWQRGNVGQ